MMKLLKSLGNILKSKLAITLYILLGITLILYAFGFRITYDPKLDNNWTAISAIGQWAGALVSLFIPIAVVYIEKTISENRKQIGESNIELLKEFEEFKADYGEKIKHLSRLVDDRGNITIDGGMFGQNNMSNQIDEKLKLKLKALKFINISMSAKTTKIAEHLNVGINEAFDILYEMLMNDMTISVVGILHKDKPEDVEWIKKK